MSTTSRDQTEWPVESRTCWLNAEMAELSLLPPIEEAARMERLAHSHGLTLGRLIRLLIRDYLRDRAATGPIRNPPMGKLAIPWGGGFDSQDASR